MDQRTLINKLSFATMVQAVAQSPAMRGMGAFGLGAGNQIIDFFKHMLEPWHTGRKNKHHSRTPRVSNKVHFREVERRRRKARAAQQAIAQHRGLNRSHP